MNYRHAFHAGNFADVLKHATLALVIGHMKQKPKPFRLIDTHSGAGVYPLLSGAAERTGEWRDGIGRILGEDVGLPHPIAALLSPYLTAIRAENLPGQLARYPGSPVIAHRLMRDEDRLVLNELQPEERGELESRFARDRRVTILDLDGYVALRSALPPPERRGLVLIDPPFEVQGELERMGEALQEAVRRFAATGTVMLWYPLKDQRATARFLRRLGALELAKLLSVELRVIGRPIDTRLPGCGLVILNPPFTLADQLRELMPFLTERLAQDRSASFTIGWLGPG